MDKLGNTIDFYLSSTRNAKAAKRFLGKALRGLKEWEQPKVLNTDKAPTYAPCSWNTLTVSGYEKKYTTRKSLRVHGGILDELKFSACK